MKPEFLFLCNIEDTQARARIADCCIITEIEAATEADALAYVSGKQGLIVPYTPHMLVTKAVIDRGAELKLVGATYGGTRQNIEDLYALEKGLTVIHTGASRPRPMAEYVLGLILSSLLRIHNYHHDMRSGEAWPRFKYGRTRILEKRKVGIVGFGRIGRGIVDLLRHFTDEIAVRSEHLSPEAAAELGVRKMELNELFSVCEIIILAGGYTPETHHLIGAAQFAAMQDGAVFVNIARGKMVDQEAMIAAVTARPIFLALDVFENEPLESDSPLRLSDRVLLTPHRANNSIEFEKRWECLADEIELFCAGKKPESALTVDHARRMSES